MTTSTASRPAYAPWGERERQRRRVVTTTTRPPKVWCGVGLREGPTSVQAEVVTELDRLGEFAPGWDALAVANDRPRASPAWTLAWYRHALPTGAVIRVVVVTDGAAVVGVAPFYVVRTGAGFYRYELAAPMLHGVEPLYSPGRHDEVGHCVGAALAGADPTPDMVSLDWLPAGSPLVPALRAGWPRPRLGLVDGHTFPAPRVILGDRDFAAWVAARSSKFRAEFRSDHRKIVAAGFEHKMSTEPSEILDRLPDMQRLYERRRQARGGAGHTFDDRFMAVVAEAVTHSPSGACGSRPSNDPERSSPPTWS